MKIKAILLSLLCFVGITTATAQSDVWVWKGGSAVKTEMADSITFTAPASGNPQVDDARALAEATTEDIGKIIGEDGKIYATKEAAEAAGITAVAMIAYVGNDAETNSTYRHGLALALKDVSGNITWCSQFSATCLGTRYYSVSAVKGDMAGLANILGSGLGQSTSVIDLRISRCWRGESEAVEVFHLYSLAVLPTINVALRRSGGDADDAQEE